MSLGISALFGITLASAALPGVGRRGGFYSHMFPDVYLGWFMPVGFVLFYKVYSKHIGLLEKYLRILLHSWGFPFSVCQCLQHFWKCRSCIYLALSDGGSKVARAFYSTVPAKAGLLVPSNLLGGLLSCLRIFHYFTARLGVLLLGSWSPQSSRFSWELSEVFVRTAIRLQETPREVCSLPYVLLVFW